MEDIKEAYDKMVKDELITIFPDEGLLLLKVKRSDWNQVGGFVAFLQREQVELAFKCAEKKYIYIKNLVEHLEKKHNRCFRADVINIES